MKSSYASLLLFIFPAIFRNVVCERDNIVYCGACIALIEEINWQTGITDPKKKIQVGGYQLDPKGNMNARVVPLSTSEAHLIEVMEVVCRYMNYYARNTDPKGNTNYIRTASRDGNVISKKHTDAIEDIKNTLQFACDFVLEHHDDRLLRMYQAKEEDIAEKLCVDITGLCTKENVTDQLWAYAAAVMLGMTENAAAKGDPVAKEMLRDNGVDDEDDEEDVSEDDDDVEEISSDDDDDDDDQLEGGKDEHRETIKAADSVRTEL